MCRCPGCRCPLPHHECGRVWLHPARGRACSAWPGGGGADETVASKVGPAEEEVSTATNRTQLHHNVSSGRTITSRSCTYNDCGFNHCPWHPMARSSRPYTSHACRRNFCACSCPRLVHVHANARVHAHVHVQPCSGGASLRGCAVTMGGMRDGLCGGMEFALWHQLRRAG